MPIYHVVAMAKNRVIGKDNHLPWHFPADLKFFKQLTTGSTVIMGRKTFESIYDRLKKPLPERANFVLSKQKPLWQFENLQYFSEIRQAIQAVRTPEAYIIGGAAIFEQTLLQIDGIYLTSIDQAFDGDTFYPELPAFFQEENRTLLQENPKIEIIFYRKQTA